MAGEAEVAAEDPHDVVHGVDRVVVNHRAPAAQRDRAVLGPGLGRGRGGAG